MNKRWESGRLMRSENWLVHNRFQVLVLLLLLLGGFESIAQRQETQYVGSVAQEVVLKSHASTPEERIVALRSYLRAKVRFRGAPTVHRPFMRATAADTLR